MARILLAALLAPLVAAAGEPPPYAAEIAGLLTQLERSGCQFYRNGTWYDSKDARAHLQQKLDYLQRKGLVKKTEDFIELAGSTSSTSGQPYQVKCGANPPVTSARWLNDALASARNDAAARR